LSSGGIEILPRKYRNSGRDLDRLQKLRVFDDHKEAKLQTSAVVVVSWQV